MFKNKGKEAENVLRNFISTWNLPVSQFHFCLFVLFFFQSFVSSIYAITLYTVLATLLLPLHCIDISDLLKTTNPSVYISNLNSIFCVACIGEQHFMFLRLPGKILLIFLKQKSLIICQYLIHK